MTSLLEAALRYAHLGVPVFPVHYPMDGGNACSCSLGGRCENIGKHPATRNGLHDATTDIIQIEKVWAKYPTFNIGLATGHVFDALDFDSGDSVGTLQDEVKQHWGDGWKGGWICNDNPPVIRTGRGNHVYYQPTGLGNRAAIVEGVDWRGKGGYVLAPPSLHQNGRRYELAEWGGTLASIPPAPEILVQLVGKTGPWSPESKHRPADPDLPILDQLDTMSAGTWNPQGLLEVMSVAPEGQRNTTLHWCFCRVFEDLVLEQACTDDEARAALIALKQAALDVGLGEDEIDKTMGSARRNYE